MSLVKINIYFFVFAFLFSCTYQKKKDNFYSYTKSSDLWRFPLIKPYEIVSPTNSNDWFFILRTPELHQKDFFNNGEFQLTAIDSVGIKDSIIVIVCDKEYWPKLGGDYKTTFLLNVKTHEQFIYSNQHHQKELTQKLNELNITSIKIYPFKEVKDSFQISLNLPSEWPRK